MHLGLENTKLIHRIIINPQNTNEVLIGAMGSAWGASEDRGVYKTIDGGETWEKILYVNDQVGVADMVQDPKNPNKIIAAMWEFGRKPWTFNSGGKGSGMYLTYDGGKNWKKLTEDEGMPKGDLGRIGLAIAPSKPNIVYALIEAKENGLYKSTDGGENWSLVSKENIGIVHSIMLNYMLIQLMKTESLIYGHMFPKVKMVERHSKLSWIMEIQFIQIIMLGGVIPKIQVI